jgi:hypothetical protein
VEGRSAPAAPAYGWARQFAVAGGGAATLHFEGSALIPVGVTLETLVWLALAAIAIFGRSGLVRRRRARNRSTVRGGARSAAGSAPGVQAEVPAAPVTAPIGATKHEAGV